MTSSRPVGVSLLIKPWNLERGPVRMLSFTGSRRVGSDRRCPELRGARV